MEEVELREKTEPWPCLVFRHGPGWGKLTLCSISDDDDDHKPRVFSVPELQHKEVWNYCHGWLILAVRRHSYTQFSLWNFTTLQIIASPRLEVAAMDVNINACILSSPPSSLDSTVFVFDCGSKSIWFCRMHHDDKRWIRQCYGKTIGAMNEEEGKNYKNDHLQTPAVTNEGKLYALTYRRRILVRIDVVEKYDQGYYTCFLHLEPLVCLPCPVKQVGRREISEKLVESGGEIFALSAAFENRDSQTRFGNETIDVEIYKVNVSAKAWERVASAKDQAFFFCAEIAFSCSTLCSGIRGNRVYFARERDAHLYSYDIEEGALSVTLPCPDLLTLCPSPMWIMPHIRSTNFHSQTLLANGKEEQDRDEKLRDIEMEENNANLRNLLDFPLDVLKYISEKLNFFAYKNFGVASTMCREIAPPLEINHFVSPWLFSFTGRKGLFSFLSPEHGDRYLVQVPDSLQDATLCHCKDGWLLMSKCIGPQQLSLYFVNPFTKNVIRYPDLFSTHLSSSQFGFSSPPTSPSCVVVVIAFSTVDFMDMVGVSICSSREKGWIYFELRNYVSFLKSFGHLIFANGAFYSMSQYGELGVLRLEGDRCNWRVLEETKRCYLYSYQGFLAEHNGELVSVFICDTGKWMAFKFDSSRLRWTRITSLGKHTMYASRLSAILTEAETRDMEDKIVLPKFHDKGTVSLCLKTGKICSCGSLGPLKNFYGTREQLRCCWIQARWARSCLCIF